MTRQHTAVVVAMNGLQLLDLAGPIEVLSMANLVGAEPSYRTLIATPGSADVLSTYGVRVGADVSLGELARSRHPVDTLTVVGGRGTFDAVADDRFVADVARLSRRAGRATSVCTGSMVLAAAGLPDRYAATTHWASSDGLAAHDAIEVRHRPHPRRDHTARRPSRPRWLQPGTHPRRLRPGDRLDSGSPRTHHLHDLGLHRSAVAGRSGLLDGPEATTNWRAWERLRGYGAQPVAQRVVFQGKVVTGAGVSAGIDVALAVLAAIEGPEAAQATQLNIEHDPQPPFDTGAPSKAPPDVRALADDLVTRIGDARRALWPQGRKYDA